MDFSSYINDHLAASLEVVGRTVTALGGDIGRAAARMIDALEDEGRILACGNGGSASDALHFSSELLNRYRCDRRPLAAIALVADVATLTSIGNDYGYEQVFSKQVQALGRPGDVLLAITTSGRSGNVLAAQRAAADRGIDTVLLTGRDGGESARLCRPGDILLRVDNDVTAHIQEAHGLIIHCLCGLIEEHFLAHAGNRGSGVQ
jgi:D-sedoheptulose 7-phosphate isomerase